jgi:DNA-binding CsgD family transcriptional regulator
MSVTTSYAFANLLARFATQTAVIVECGYRLIGAMVLLNAAYAFIYVCRELLQKKVSRIFKQSYLWISFALLLILFFFSIRSMTISSIYPILMVNVIVIVLVFVTMYATIIYLLSRIKLFKESRKRKAVTVFGNIGLAASTPFLIFLILHLLSVVSNNVLTVFASLFFFVINGMPVLYLKRIMEMYHGTLEIIQEKGVSLEKICKKYKISKREQEIILLICEGKSNKEIEDDLFISLQTVKDHIYRIYQKTGAKNRVQLTNLFRHASKNSHPDTEASSF